jgi:hypothetical protein
LTRRAETSIHRALALDPNLSEAYDAQGNLLRDTNRPGAEEAYRRAIELNPNNATAWHDYAVFLSNNAHRSDEAARATIRSLELDPRQPVTWTNYLTHVLETQGRKRFEAEYARAMRTVGDMPGAAFRFRSRCGRVTGWVRMELGKLIDKARGDAGVLDSLTLPNATIAGFPVEVLKAGLAKPQSESDVALPTWINYSAAWFVTDPQRSASYVPAHLGPVFKHVPLMLESQVAGLQGDWTRLDRVLRQMRTEMGEDNRTVQSIVAFWALGGCRCRRRSPWRAHTRTAPRLSSAAITGVAKTARFAYIAAPAAPRWRGGPRANGSNSSARNGVQRTRNATG